MPEHNNLAAFPPKKEGPKGRESYAAFATSYKRVRFLLRRDHSDYIILTAAYPRQRLRQSRTTAQSR
eukprot:scaffold58899_cov23-Prasinocladus_malaysianus.AAC.1